MSQTDALAILNTAIAPTQYAEEDVNAVTKSADFLPRFQLCSGQSELTMKQLVAAGNFALVYSNDPPKYVDLGKEVIAIALDWHPKALRLPKTGGNPLSYYDRNKSEFQAIQAESKVSMSGCMFGPEFLIWVPDKDLYATYFFGSWSARKESAALLTLMTRGEDGGRKQYGPSPFMINTKIGTTTKDGRKISYYIPNIMPYSGSIDPVEDFEGRVVEEITNFRNVKDSQVEKVAEPAAGGRTV